MSKESNKKAGVVYILTNPSFERVYHMGNVKEFFSSDTEVLKTW